LGAFPFMWMGFEKVRRAPAALTCKASNARAAPPTQPLAPTPVKSRMAAGFKSLPGASLVDAGPECPPGGGRVENRNVNALTLLKC